MRALSALIADPSVPARILPDFVDPDPYYIVSCCSTCHCCPLHVWPTVICTPGDNTEKYTEYSDGNELQG
jgi:hypothetical protein